MAARSKRQVTDTFPAEGHDHHACIADAMAAAAALCRNRGARLTELRQRVLALVWDSHAPIGAYQVLEKLAREDRRAAPPTVYRALDFLVAHGLVHRIESMSAYVGCADPGTPHAGQFLICGDCGAAAELDDARIARAVRDGCGQAGFRMRRLTVEVEGLCPRCQPTGVANDV